MTGIQQTTLFVPPSRGKRLFGIRHRLATLTLLVSSGSGFVGAQSDLSPALQTAIEAENWDQAIALATVETNVVTVKLLPSLHQARGEARFFTNNIKGSIEDFDLYLKAYPKRTPHHWQRGLSYYYSGRFADGVRQFESHQVVNGTDVENAVWHVACLVRGGLKLAAARKKMYPYAGDRRIPMQEIHGLFAGTATKDDVLMAARANAEGRDLRNRLCYAHLYLGLFAEINNQPAAAQQHLRAAAETYRMDHYMGKLAQLHWQRIRPKVTTDAAPAELKKTKRSHKKNRSAHSGEGGE